MPKDYKLDFSNTSNELKLLIEIINENNSDYEDYCIESFLNIDWELFLRLTIHHRVYPLVYTRLKGINKEWLPSFVINTLYQEYKKNTIQMLHLSSEMEQISKLFTEHQIRILFLKGPAIAYEIYGDISQRTSKDLDILIPLTQLERVEKLLLDRGYKKEVEEKHDILREHHKCYSHPHKNIQLEIHWRLEPFPSIEPRFNELWSCKRVSALTNYPVYFLAEEHLFWYLVRHGARHGWFRLRWLVDIDHMLKRGIDINKTRTLFKDYRSEHIGGQTLILASQLLNTPINNNLKILMVRERSKVLAQKALFFINKIVSLSEISSTNYYKGYIFSLKTSYQKVGRLMLIFYPSSSDAKLIWLPKKLQFLYFPLRPFLVIWRRTKR